MQKASTAARAASDLHSHSCGTSAAVARSLASTSCEAVALICSYTPSGSFTPSRRRSVFTALRLNQRATGFVTAGFESSHEFDFCSVLSLPVSMLFS